MRLIDADDCKDLMYVMCAGQDKAFIRAMEQVIDDCPDVDASPIVRCRECIHLGHVHDFMGLEIESFQCGRTNTEVKLDDFCSYGGREESK